jgi:ATP-dependent protease ClpP protease subunit
MRELLIYTDIGENFWGDSVSAQSVKTQLDEMGAGDLNVRINSPGGSVFDGFAIYNLLNQREGKTTVYIDGLAASAASVVAMAGDEIIMADNALMMIHDPWTMSLGSADEMRETADLLDKIKGAIVTTYASKSSLAPPAISDMMLAETWFNADEAIEHGFATAKEDGGQSVSNLAKPWIRSGPRPDQIAPAPEAQTAWRLAANKRKFDMLHTESGQQADTARAAATANSAA